MGDFIEMGLTFNFLLDAVALGVLLFGDGFLEVELT